MSHVAARKFSVDTAEIYETKTVPLLGSGPATREVGFDPASIIAMITTVQGLIANLCGNKSPTELATEMKAGSPSMDGTLWDTCEEVAFNEITDDRIGKHTRPKKGKGKRKTWKASQRVRKQTLAEKRRDATRRNYHAQKLQLQRTSVEELAAQIKERRKG